MNNLSKKMNIIFAGGGTGGHLYPLLAIADYLKSNNPEFNPIFVGASDRLEASVVPEAGYKFHSLWISGIIRKIELKNFLLPFKFIYSFLKSYFLCLYYSPKIVVGSGAYVAGVFCAAAKFYGAKLVLLEQNVTPGLTNKKLSPYADLIVISYDESAKYFKSGNIRNLGNPIRHSVKIIPKAEAVKNFGLSEDRFTILVLGGSLGSEAINEIIFINLDRIITAGFQMIWQTGKSHISRYSKFGSPKVKILPYLDDVGIALSSADVVISRAGATTLAEFSALQIASILIPSPYVTDNHQYKNAKLLSDTNAAILLNEKDAKANIFSILLELKKNPGKLELLRKNIGENANPEAASNIASEIIELAVGKKL